MRHITDVFTLLRRHAALVSMRKERADRILLIGGETSMGPIGMY